MSAGGARARKTASKDQYHHGDLRSALVKVARAMVEKEGAPNVALRAVAAAAGVSPNAPYHHFTDKAALLAAVAEDGFREFRDVVEARGAGESNPFVRLRKLAVGYVEFAVSAPELFRLMFGPMLHHEDFPELASGGAASVASLEEAVGACMPGAPRARVRSASAAAWSLVHGLAVLCNDGRIRVSNSRDLERRVMAVIAHFQVLSTEL